MAYIGEGKMKRQIKFLKENYLLAIGFSLMFLSFKMSLNIKNLIFFIFFCLLFFISHAIIKDARMYGQRRGKKKKEKVLEVLDNDAY